MNDASEEAAATLRDTYPEASCSDVALAVVRAAASVIPIAGGPLDEILGLVIGAPVCKRRDKWLKELAGAVEDIRRNVAEWTPEKLATNPVWVSAAIQATRIAVGAHHAEKSEYLRNALLAIGTGPTSDGTKEQIFLNAIEAFTPAHVKALNLMWRNNLNAAEWEAQSIPLPQRDYIAAIGIAAPEVRGQHDLIKHLIHDLLNRGFSGMGGPGYPYPQAGMVTNLGIEFLTFILRPL